MTYKPMLEILNEISDISSFKNELQNLKSAGEIIWQRGWGEAKAGNVSIRLPQKIINDVVNYLAREYSNSIKNPVISDELGWLLMSASGSRFREYKNESIHNFALSAFSADENSDSEIHDRYKYPPNIEVTSEWITHAKIQNWLAKNRSDECVVLHAHVTDWIILSNLELYKNNKPRLFREISDCLPELKYYFPFGARLLSFEKPGSQRLAHKTIEAIQETNVVVWEKHGIVVTSESVNVALDYLELMSKAADVYLKSVK